MGLNPKKYCIDKSIKYFSTLGCRIRIPPIDLQLAIQQNIIFKKYYKNVKNVKGKPIVKHLEDFLQKNKSSCTKAYDCADDKFL